VRINDDDDDDEVQLSVQFTGLMNSSHQWTRQSDVTSFFSFLVRVTSLLSSLVV